MRQCTVVGLGLVLMLAATVARPAARATQTATPPAPDSPATPARPAVPATPPTPAAVQSPEAPPAPVASEPGVMRFDDEFDGPALDRTKWNVIVTGRTVNNENEAYVDSPDTIDIVTGADAEGADGGALRIRARYRPGYTSPEGRKYDFISGRLDTRGKVEFTYGTAAARMKLPAGAGFWPAFWLLGTGRWPDTGEADIMENVGDPSWTNAAMHGPGYFGNTPLVRRAPLPAGDVTGWHIYSVDWTPDSLTFKVDGQEMYRVTKAMVEQYGPWAYDNAKFLILNLAIGGQYPQSVNHATEPYPGLPQASVDLIKSDTVAVLVDWVRGME